MFPMVLAIPLPLEVFLSVVMFLSLEVSLSVVIPLSLEISLPSCSRSKLPP